MKNKIWIVEIKHNGRWLPTTGAGLDKIGGSFEMKVWKRRNPDDEFRLTKYTADTQGKRGPR